MASYQTSPPPARVSPPLFGNSPYVYTPPTHTPQMRTSQSPPPSSSLSYFTMFSMGVIFGFVLWSLMVSFISLSVITENNPPPPSNPSSRTSSTQNRQTSPGGASPPASSAPYTAVKFDDIVGVDEAKTELYDVIDFLRHPARYASLNARVPRGVLLVGLPGTGKTLLARAVATEANISCLISVSGSEFVEMYVGLGARRIRKLFQDARANAPCIIFIDEFDALATRRSVNLHEFSREHDQTLNQLLVEMDGFNTGSNSQSVVIVLAATNRFSSLDPALLRPGRFDRIVRISLPDTIGRERILKLYLDRVPSKVEAENVSALARVTSGFSGADLANLVNEAAIMAARGRKICVMYEDLIQARDKISLGPSRLSVTVPMKQKEATAYHEAGHALVAYFLYPLTDPIHQITIVFHGDALGVVELTPSEDTYTHIKAKLQARMAVAMGGRTAEILVFGRENVSSGASSDIRTVTRIAEKMVKELGMSERLGPLDLRGTLSGKVAAQVEAEIMRFVKNAVVTAERILRKYRKELGVVARALLEKETLSGSELEKLLRRESGDVFGNSLAFIKDSLKSFSGSNTNSSSPAGKPASAIAGGNQLTKISSIWKDAMLYITGMLGLRGNA